MGTFSTSQMMLSCLWSRLWINLSICTNFWSVYLRSSKAIVLPLEPVLDKLVHSYKLLVSALALLQGQPVNCLPDGPPVVLIEGFKCVVVREPLTTADTTQMSEEECDNIPLSKLSNYQLSL